MSENEYKNNNKEENGLSSYCKIKKSYFIGSILAISKTQDNRELGYSSLP